MLTRLLALLAIVFLTACGADHKWASDEEVAKARYVAGPPATVTLLTSINDRSNEGSHSALIINGRERVLFDPAGSWELLDGGAPERLDLHYGMTPSAVASFVWFQSNGIFSAHLQTVTVPQSVADQLIDAAAAHGAAPKATCSYSISGILSKTPGFESLPVTFFPKKLQRAFAKLPGVVTQDFTDFDTTRDVVRLGGAPLVAAN